MKLRENTAQNIVSQAMEEGPGEFSSKDPMVLSCGGVYIPHRKNKRQNKRLWEVINLADIKHPTKVVSSRLPRSPLDMILKKESLN